MKKTKRFLLGALLWAGLVTGASAETIVNYSTVSSTANSCGNNTVTISCNLSCNINCSYEVSFDYYLYRDNDILVTSATNQPGGTKQFTVSSSGNYYARVTFRQKPTSSSSWVANYQYVLSNNSVNVTQYATPTISANINGTAFSMASAQNIYKCTPVAITLNSTTTGNPTSYQLTVYNSNSLGGQVSTYYSSGWVATAPPAAINLKASTSGNLDAVTSPFPKYFLVKLEAKNGCNPSSPTSTTTWIKLNDPANSSNFQMVNTSSTLSNISQNINAPTLLGGSSAALNGQSSTGLVDWYYVTFEEVNPTTGAVIATIPNRRSSQQTVSGGSMSTVAAMNFRSLTYYPPGGYNWDWNILTNLDNRKFKVTLTVGNACGSNSNWSYFKIPSTDAYNRLIAPGEETSSIEQELNLKSYPNPAKDVINFEYNLYTAAKIKVRITDALGRMVISEEYNQEEGTQFLDINTTEFQPGMYFYTIFINEEAQTGKFIKE